MGAPVWLMTFTEYAYSFEKLSCCLNETTETAPPVKSSS